MDKQQTVQKVIQSISQSDLTKTKEHEALLRMNFLTQASFLISPISEIISRQIFNECKDIAQKKVLRICPQLKNKYCKKCGFPFNDWKPKIKKIGCKKFLVKNCQKCGQKKKIFICKFDERKNH